MPFQQGRLYISSFNAAYKSNEFLVINTTTAFSYAYIHCVRAVCKQYNSERLNE